MSAIFSPAGTVLPAPAFSQHIVVSEGQLLCSQSGFLHSTLPPDLLTVSSHYLGELCGEPCGVHLVTEQADVAGCSWSGLRSLLGVVDHVHFALAGRALQVVSWDLDHRYCGRCGKATEYHQADRARVCLSCGFTVYPRISPCVIMLVTRGDQCLLAQHRHHQNALFTALAGFIEPGETAEQAVAREVREEVGLDVGEATYVGSQPWPFPGQLMLGFQVEYTGGILSPDGDEISQAAWFSPDKVPELIPPVQTLSGQLIRAFIERH